MEKEEMKDDIFDLVSLKSQEKLARPLSEYHRLVHIVVTQPLLSRDDHTANLAAIEKIADSFCGQPASAALRSGPATRFGGDFIVLPELFFRSRKRGEYEAFVRDIAHKTDACVIGGSQHVLDGEALINSGVVTVPDGEIIAKYAKNHPYGKEADEGVEGRSGLCQFIYKETKCAVLICADAWDHRLLNELTTAPDIIFIVAESVSEEHAPEAARRLWHALAISRSFELCSVVAISDWAEGKNQLRATCGVAGIADPSDRTGLFQPVPVGSPYHIFDIDLGALHALRTTRRSRSFYWTD